MSEITDARAIELSRKYFDLEEFVPASIWRVTNLNNQANNYFLVVFGESNASVAVATVGISNGEIGNSARLLANAPHLNVTKERALIISTSDENVSIELVWKPGNLSFSPLYPIWKVNLPSGSLYINQAGIVSDNLENSISG